MKKLRIYKGDIVFRGGFMLWGIAPSELIFVIDNVVLNIDPQDQGDWRLLHSPFKNKIKRLFKL